MASRDKDATSIDHLITMPRFTILILIVLLAGCAKSPERTALDKANAFLDEGRVQAAQDTVEHYLRQHPDSAMLLRMRVVVLLREQQLDRAALAIQQVPAGRSIAAELLRHHNRIVREGAAKLISDQPNPNDFHELVRALDDSRTARHPVPRPAL